MPASSAAWLKLVKPRVTSGRLVTPNEKDVASPKIDEAKLQADAERARTRAHTVAWALRNPDPDQGFLLRQSLGWIAVSGEIDEPDRPVNVPSGIFELAPDGHLIKAFPQYDVPVTTCSAKGATQPCSPATPGSVTFLIRFAIASPPPAGPVPAAVPFKLDELPPAPPIAAIPDKDDIILYLHGGPGSRLEEAGDLVKPLHDAGLARGKRYTVISFDQPSQGYSSMIDPDCIEVANTGAAGLKCGP